MPFSRKLSVEPSNGENPLKDGEPTDLYHAFDQYMHSDRKGFDPEQGQGPGRIYMARQLVAASAYAAAHNQEFGKHPFMSASGGIKQGKVGEDTGMLPTGAEVARYHWERTHPQVPPSKVLTFNASNSTAKEIQVVRRLVEKYMEAAQERVRILLVTIPEHAPRALEVARNHCRYWKPENPTDITVANYDEVRAWVQGSLDPLLKRTMDRVFDEDLVSAEARHEKIAIENAGSTKLAQLMDTVATFLTGSRGVASPLVLGANVAATDDGLVREGMPNVWTTDAFDEKCPDISSHRFQIPRDGPSDGYETHQIGVDRSMIDFLLSDQIFRA